MTKKQEKSSPPLGATMLETWSTCISERIGIELFLEWLIAVHGTWQVHDIDPNKVLDQYHNIDRRQLDLERRALLQAVAATQREDC